MSDGRKAWFPKDTGWWSRERVVILGEEFGADGPAVIDWLTLEAKSQRDHGYVKTGVRAIARGCFVEVVTVGHVLSRSVTLGALDDFRESGVVITCRVSGFDDDDNRGRAAWRQQDKRAREAGSSGSGHALSRPVTESHRKFDTREERTTTPLTPLEGGNDFPSKPVGGRKRDEARYVASCRALSRRLFPLGPEDVAEHCVDQAVRAGAKDEGAVLAHARQWFPPLAQGAA